jgi:peptide/nickel transport system substrate-binding protein
MQNVRLVRVACVALGLILAGTGCSGRARAPRGTSGRGGTLRVLSVGDVDSLDTAVAYTTTAWSLARGYARTLYSHDASNPTVPVPDLADGPPSISADHRTYTFRLRGGVRYAPKVNREVTAQDFVTAVERLYNKKTPSGGRNYADLIAGAQEFGRGEASRIKGLRATDARTLAITLVKPAGDFLSIVALPFFAPVPGEYAAHYSVGAGYSGHVAGTGPYTIQRYVPGRSIVLGRNPNWDPATDPLRKAWVDRIQVTEGGNPETIDTAIERGAADLPFDTGPPNARLRAFTTDPELSKRFRAATTGCLDYLVLETSRAAGPIADVRVRRALNYAVDKVAALQARGPRRGPVASTILTPSSAGYQSYNLYPTPGDRGDPAKARALLAQASYPDGLTLSYVGSSNSHAVEMRRAIQTSLAKVGIRLQAKTYPEPDNYFRSLQLPSKRREHQIGEASWCPDWPGDNARGVIVSLLDGRLIRPSGNYNYGEYDNPTVNRMIDQALAEPDRTIRAALWGKIDERVMQDAPWVPLTYRQDLFYWSARVQDWTYDPWTNFPDITALRLKPTQP